MIKKINKYFVDYFSTKKLRHSILMLICIVIAVAVVFYSILTISLLVFSLNESENNALEFASSQLVSDLDEMIQRYQLLAADLAYNYNLTKELTIPVNNIAEMLEIKKNINDIINTKLVSFLYSEDEKRGLVPSFYDVNIYAKNPIFAKTESAILYLDDFKNTVWQKAIHDDRHALHVEYTPSVIILTRAIIDINTEKIEGAVKIELPLHKIERIIENVFEKGEYKSVITTKNNKIIVSTLSEKIKETIFNANQFKRKYFVNLHSDDNLNVNFYTMKDKRSYNAKIFLAGLLTLGVCGLLALGMFFIGKVVSKSFAKDFEDFTAVVQKLDASADIAKIIFPENESELGLVGKELNKMIRRLTKLIVQEKKHSKLMHNMQLEILQEQINPHFLYNTLSAMNYKAKKIGSSEMEQVSENLIEFYRGILNHGKLIRSLRNEVETSIAYCDVMKFVYEIDLDVTFEIDDELLNFYVIKLIFQPIIENSILHGILPNREGCIYITAKRNEDKIDISISDNGRGISPKKLEKLKESIHNEEIEIGYGMRNVAKRLENYYGKNSCFEITSVVGMGTEVKMTIPCDTKSELQKRSTNT